MEIRKSTEQDLEDMLRIYDAARSFMASHSNPHQWGHNSWPPETLLRKDIPSGNSYIRVYADYINKTDKIDLLMGTTAESLITEDGKVVIQHDNDWALDMLQASSAKQMLSRVFSAELKRPVDAQSFVFEVKSAKESASDTILDDLIEAAEQP